MSTLAGSLHRGIRPACGLWLVRVSPVSPAAVNPIALNLHPDHTHGFTVQLVPVDSRRWGGRADKPNAEKHPARARMARKPKTPEGRGRVRQAQVDRGGSHRLDQGGDGVPEVSTSGVWRTLVASGTSCVSHSTCGARTSFGRRERVAPRPVCLRATRNAAPQPPPAAIRPARTAPPAFTPARMANRPGRHATGLVHEFPPRFYGASSLGGRLRRSSIRCDGPPPSPNDRRKTAIPDPSGVRPSASI